MITPRLGWKAASSSLQTVRSNNFFYHAYSKALLKPTKLTSVATSLVHWAVFISETHIFRIFLHCTFEKTLAAFTSSYSIMLTCCIVPANRTNKDHTLRLQNEKWMVRDGTTSAFLTYRARLTDGGGAFDRKHSRSGKDDLIRRPATKFMHQ